MIYTKNCTVCDSVFETPTYNKKKCKPECGRSNRASKNAARKTEREAHEVEFIGVDGEGVNTYKYVLDLDEEGNEIEVRIPYHKYVLLSVGDQSLHKNGAELTHLDIFPFLWEQYKAHPEAAFVGFALKYDFTMWFRSLNHKAAWQLLHREGIDSRKRRVEEAKHLPPFPVRDRSVYDDEDGNRIIRAAQWEFDILGMKRFKLRPFVPREQWPTRTVLHKDGTMSTVASHPHGWLYICDTFSFFQSSFLKAIDPTGKTIDPVVSLEEFATIQRGKERRADADFDPEMIAYNVLENDVLARVMGQLNAGFVSDGIKLAKQQWMGPGQAAQAWMKLVGVPTGEQVRDCVPKWALDAAQFSYYGGWFEIFSHGPVPGTSYSYDINSAYPATIRTLPCLLHGHWTRGAGKPGRLPKRSIRLVYGTFKGQDQWVGSLPHRMKDGRILRPWDTRGWYWHHEVEAARRAKVLNRADIEQWVQYDPCDCPPPMRGIEELYQGRLLVNKNSARGKAKKLVYNSAYGKCAQSVGNPKYSNSVYASFITSMCRTQILDAIATHPTRTESLLMIATDGIVFKEPHPGLDVDPTALGKWDASTHENLSLFMPGLYWDDDARASIAAGEDAKLKSRGVSSKLLSPHIASIDALWNQVDEYGCTIVPRYALPVQFALVGAREAATRGKWWTCGDIVKPPPGKKYAERVLNGDIHSKRESLLNEKKWGAWRSVPYVSSGTLESTPYSKRFGAEDELEDAQWLDEAVTPDGTVAETRAWGFKQQ